jgi:hypothetical protein
MMSFNDAYLIDDGGFKLQSQTYLSLPLIKCYVQECIERECLDISVTKDSRLLLYAVNSPFYWWILKKVILFTGFKNPHKKSAEQEYLSLFMVSILQNAKKEVRKPHTNSKGLKFMPRNLDKKM